MALNPNLRKMVNAAANKYSQSSGKAEKPKEGRNTYRILVPTNPELLGPNGEFWADLGVHWIKADENGKPIAVVGDCDTVYQQPSQINAAIEMAISSAHDEESKKLFASWKAKKSVLLNVIDRAKDEVIVLELTSTTFGKVMDLVGAYFDAGQDITDQTTGMDIVITRTGKGLNTDYSVMASPGVSKPVSNEHIAACHDLKSFIEKNFFRGEEQKALNAIQQIAGVAVPRLTSATGAGSVTPTAALNSPAASVAPVIQPTPAPVAPVAAAPAVDPQVAALQAQLAALQAQTAAAQAAPAPVAAAPAPAAPAPALSSDDEAAILAELDGLN